MPKKIDSKDRGSIANQIYEDMLEQIIILKLEPGEMVSENNICQEYGVSRSVIRTVFARLKQAGFIEIYPQRGSFISRINLEHIKHLLSLRCAVEKDALIEVIKTLGTKERNQLLSKLEENMRIQRPFIERQTYNKEFLEIDKEFHRMILDSVGKMPVMMMIEDRLHHIARYRYYCMAYFFPLKSIYDEHIEIINAIKESDLDKGMEILDRHLKLKTMIPRQMVIDKNKIVY